MPDATFGPLRIWDGPPTAGDPPAYEALASDEVLRQPRQLEAVEPLSLEWYLELQTQRHRRQGHWIPRLLEFGRHRGERILVQGRGLGSDWVGYAQNGAEVTCASASADQLALVRRNFELRGLRGTFLHAAPPALPLESAAIDVVCLTGVLHEQEPAPVIDEVYRVLKPGGKVIAIVPARYDVDFWSLFGHRPEGGPGGLLSATARRFCRRELRQLFGRFHDPKVHKRHLRRAEVPHLWRWLPLTLLERLLGRLLVFKAFKPVSAAIGEQAAA